ncbi:MAG: DUF177 domain-containing protein [Coriobacteriia bacterium]|nr:DUF177 domain-containing protein [Coriobacteriia bacterium]
MGASTYIALTDELFEVSGGSAFSGELDLAELKAGPDTLRFADPIPWNVFIANTGEGSLLVTGSINAVATTDCARCLEPFELDLEGEVEGFVFLTDPGDDLPEGMEEDEFEVVDEHKGVDIRAFLEAALVLDMPLVPLHDEDCLGLCPQCGKNLNEGPCDCEKEDDSDFENAKNPFAALKDYKFDN